MTTYTNRLVNESSPYLLQHAHNPVDWYPWGDEALERARREDKPILISIGYAACHWCHVMERESFEDPVIAARMNEYFINIKVDREERPDVDHIYMDAVQAMTGSGGWPLHVFLTSEGKPFYGGTYFPPKPYRNHMAWKDVIEGVARTYKEKRKEVEEQASHLTDHLIRSSDWGITVPAVSQPTDLFPVTLPRKIYDTIMQPADKENGGFGKAPKFPQTFLINYLLEYYHYTNEPQALSHACLTLDKMLAGGLFDQLQGGFARYSTDDHWLVPHFEKMLYDNALLITTLCKAYQVTQHAHYLSAIQHTISFMFDEWLTDEGGFCAAYDADSEGEEGKYYVWTPEEIHALLGTEADLFCSYYQVTTAGNWESKSILQANDTIDEFAKAKGLDTKSVQSRLAAARQQLLHARNKRVKPLLDDKVILGWNALVVCALCHAFAATGNDVYREQAKKSFHFLAGHFYDGQTWLHSYKNGQARHMACLDDLALLMNAMINLQEITGDQAYLQQAKNLFGYVATGYGQSGGPYFYYTHVTQKNLIVRKLDFYDGALPSGNAVMAYNLYYLGMVFDQPNWRNQAQQMVTGLLSLIEKYPSSFGVWSSLVQGFCKDFHEIVLIGQNFNHLLKDFLRTFIPHKIFQCATLPDNDFPLLSKKPVTIEPHFYLCKNFTCAPPVKEVGELSKLMIVA